LKHGSLKGHAEKASGFKSRCFGGPDLAVFAGVATFTGKERRKHEHRI